MADVRQVHLDLLAALVLEGLLAEQVDVHGGAVVQLGGHHAGADGGAELDLHILKDLEVVGILQIALGDEHHGSLAILAGQLERLLRTHSHHGDDRCRQAGLALCFLGVKVRNSSAVLDPAHTLGSARKIDQRLGERGLAAAGMTGNQDIADVVACVFHIGFSLISAARSILSAFVAYFTKIIPHSK